MTAKKVGLPNAFTCWSPSVRVLQRFLQEVGVQVVTTPRTTPAILRAAATMCSSDFCMPVRVLVGHVHTLAVEHPDLDAIVVPNVCQERPRASNCSKYRDISGVVIRSLAGTVGYVSAHALPAARARLAALMGAGELEALARRAASLPRILEPEIWSLERESLFRVCYGVYCDIHGMGRRMVRLAAALPERLRARLSPRYAACRAAFARAYDVVLHRDRRTLDTLFRDPSKPRLAVVGRRYLHDDPLITADLKPYFRQRGCTVVTPHDVPFALLQEGFEQTQGFYETHRMYQAFLDLLADRIDGVVVIGAFGCHPDAFENTYFLEYARRRGLPAWLLKYDEQSGSGGFVTRYETILGFLEQRRSLRLRPPPPAPAPDEAARCRADARVDPARDDAAREPVLVWPHMSPVVDAVVEEILYQAGVSSAGVTPAALGAEDIDLGNYKYAESCCPYALSTGSMIRSVRRVLQAASLDGRPRRIVIVQGKGEGPCTYGWYARLQQVELPALFQDELRAGRHTMEMLSVNTSGLTDFVGQLAAMGHGRRLQPLIELVRAASAPGGLRALPPWTRWRLTLNAWRMVHPSRGLLTRTALAKVEALEAVRARSLRVRAHERVPGEGARVWRQTCAEMRDRHTPAQVGAVRRRALAALQAVDQDREPKPRVLVVGEIYVVLASFANRGTVDALLGREGIEVVEGTTLGHYLRTSLAVLHRQALRRRLRPLLAALNGGVAPEGALNADPHAAPFVLHSLGGDGRHSVSAARWAIERLGIDGIVHLYPFKCMPEMMAKTALAEMARFYGVLYLPLDFDKETDIQRLRTEVATFAAMLRMRLEQRGPCGHAERRRRQALGRALDRVWARQTGAAELRGGHVQVDAVQT